MFRHSLFWATVWTVTGIGVCLAVAEASSRLIYAHYEWKRQLAHDIQQSLQKADSAVEEQRRILLRGRH